MKKYFYTFITGISIILSNCGSNGAHSTYKSEIIEVTTEKTTKFANTILPSQLKEHLYIIASDEFEGRNTG